MSPRTRCENCGSDCSSCQGSAPLPDDVIALLTSLRERMLTYRYRGWDGFAERIGTILAREVLALGEANPRVGMLAAKPSSGAAAPNSSDGTKIARMHAPDCQRVPMLRPCSCGADMRYCACGRPVYHDGSCL